MSAEQLIRSIVKDVIEQEVRAAIPGAIRSYIVEREAIAYLNKGQEDKIVEHMKKLMRHWEGLGD